MNVPNCKLHNPDPAYIRGLLEKADVSQGEAARLLGVSIRSMAYYVSDSSAQYKPAPYLVQFALECLANSKSGST